MKLSSSDPDIRTLIERIDGRDIDLQPEFQRQEVWPVPKKKRLVDTVLRGWSIPPIHLVEIGDNKLEVLDGQQRLAALRDFLHNKFSIDGTVSPVDARVQALNGKFYRQLDVAWRRRIDQFPIRCFRITDYQPEEPSELFYRLNQPTILTAGEQRNALYGPARQQLKSMVARFEQAGNESSTIGFSNLRLAYDDVLARLLYFVEASSFGVKSTEARISERFRNKEPFSEDVIRRADESIRLFSSARLAAKPNRFNKASVLSWLLFYSRFHRHSEPPDNFLQAFLDASKMRYTAHFVTEAAAVFADRSSLRVTDVSSVVYRDFALCYVYYFVIGHGLPGQVRHDDILKVESFLRGKDDASFDFALDHILDVEAWSATL
jgi:hypothetical protein